MKKISTQNIAIFASGPSLNETDAKTLIQEGMLVIGVNNSWRIADTCHYIFAADQKWWDINYKEIPPGIKKVTTNKEAAKKHTLQLLNCNLKSYNSGMLSILLAYSLGAENIILLGFDCSIERGYHWHGKHKGMNNPNNFVINRWVDDFNNISEEINGNTNVINCSPGTRLECFKKRNLKATLHSLRKGVSREHS